MNKKITLIGRGWLGSPLANFLQQNGCHVFSTSSSSNGSDICFDITSPYLPKELEINEILIYTIPPLDKNEVVNFFSKIQDDQKIIFISSTSVYSKNLGLVDENFLLTNENTGSPTLLISEMYLKNKFKKMTIIRPGGLYGNERHPAFFLAGKNNLSTGPELLHLVHLKDCIQAISKIIDLDFWGETFNLVSDLRIEKRVYYPEISKTLNLAAPTYLDNQLTSPTNINNFKSKDKLDLVYANPLDFKIN